MRSLSYRTARRRTANVFVRIIFYSKQRMLINVTSIRLMTSYSRPLIFDFLSAQLQWTWRRVCRCLLTSAGALRRLNYYYHYRRRICKDGPIFFLIKKFMSNLLLDVRNDAEKGVRIGLGTLTGALSKILSLKNRR